MNLKNTLNLLPLLSLSLIFSTLFALSPVIAKEYKGENDKTANITLSPLSLIIFGPNIGADIKISKSFTLGAAGSYMNFQHKDAQVKGHDFRIQGTHYLSGDTFSDSWILRPQIGTRSITASSKCTYYRPCSTAKGRSYFIAAQAGYHWQWANGFNMELTAGPNFHVVKAQGTSSDNYRDSLKKTGFGLSADYKLGWAF